MVIFSSESGTELQVWKVTTDIIVAKKAFLEMVDNLSSDETPLQYVEGDYCSSATMSVFLKRVFNVT